jgi:hypothetical protein
MLLLRASRHHPALQARKKASNPPSLDLLRRAPVRPCQARLLGMIIAGGVPAIFWTCVMWLVANALGSGLHPGSLPACGALIAGCSVIAFWRITM